MRSNCTTAGQGPFDRARAERYACELLMAAYDFAGLAGRADAELAPLRGVPVDAIFARRG
jgi:hypothetical protein